VFEENPSVLLVDANGILDRGTRAGPIHKGSIQIVDGTFTVTTQLETVGHIPSTILAEIKGVLAMVRMFRVTIRNHHLRQ
jgi:hypothetical protein